VINIEANVLHDRPRSSAIDQMPFAAGGHTRQVSLPMGASAKEVLQD
jgi:hypothetical protein